MGSVIKCMKSKTVNFPILRHKKESECVDMMCVKPAT